MADTKVVFANEDVTLHKLVSESVGVTGEKYESVDGVTLRPGESVPLDSLASYQRKAAEEGKIPQVSVLSEKQAAEKNAEVNRIREMVAAGNRNDFVNLRPDHPSHSDHEVSFEDREANHRARGEEESGSGDATTDEVADAKANDSKDESKAKSDK